MPGPVAEYVKAMAEERSTAVRQEIERRQQDRGYATASRGMQRSYEMQQQNHPDASLGDKRQMVHDIALRYSDGIRNNVGDRGAGLERIAPPLYESGERHAVRDWSHTNNRELKRLEVQNKQSAHDSTLKGAAQLSDRELVSETRELHAQFKQLLERYEQAPAGQRAEIREEMQPVVNRERELRQEYTGRISQEVSRDRGLEQSIGYGR